MRVDCLKHFTEDERELGTDYEIPYKTKRYIRKLKMREACLTITSEQFIKDENYKDMNVWDLKYISTSDDEDNDSEESEEEENEEDQQKANEEGQQKDSNLEEDESIPKS